MAGIFNALYSQLWFKPPLPDSKDAFAGKTVIVTGSNIGLGFEAAKHIVALKAAKVILAVRSFEKGDAAKTSIEASTGRTGVAEVWPLDLCSYASVQAFADKAAQLDRLDVLLENAGIATPIFREAEGNESSLTTNVISTFLLALLLLPKLRETAQRFNQHTNLVIVSSAVHFYSQFPERKTEDFWRELNTRETANMKDRYNISKLLEVFYVRELAARTTAAGHQDVVINCLNPGLCHSSLSRESPFMLEVIKFFVARTTEVGSRTLVSAAAAGEETHGAYLSDCKVALPSDLVLNEPQTQKLVWEVISGKLEAIKPGIMNNV